MKHQKVSLNDEHDRNYSMKMFLSQQYDTGDPRHRRMKELLKAAIRLELTERQKACIRMYYFEKIPVAEIAELLGIRPTTVYKHLNVARRSLKKCREYL